MTAAIGILGAAIVAGIGLALVWFAMRYADREHEVVLWVEWTERLMPKLIAAGKGWSEAMRAMAVSLEAMASSWRAFSRAMTNHRARLERERTASTLPADPSSQP